jgi:hypothetical protein
MTKEYTTPLIPLDKGGIKKKLKAIAFIAL